MLFGLIFLLGIVLIAYPSVSSWWNSLHESRTIAGYQGDVSSISDEEYERMYADAVNFNKWLPNRSELFELTEAERAWYERILNVNGNGIMGFVDINAIGAHVPIGHGTEDTVLQRAAGHMEWTSVPIGGVGNHTVISGHTGLPSARLFTDIEKLVVNDTFVLNVLNESMTYQVDQIQVVLPEEAAPLMPVEDMDLCTLVTCTPYGINTHRLLVRGHRIDSVTVGSKRMRIPSDGEQIRKRYLVPFAAAVVLLLMLGWVLSDISERLRWNEDFGFIED